MFFFYQPGGVKLCFCGTAASNGPIFRPSDYRKMNMEHWRSENSEGETSARRKTCTSTILSTTNPTSTALELKPRFLREKLCNQPDGLWHGQKYVCNDIIKEHLRVVSIMGDTGKHQLGAPFRPSPKKEIPYRSLEITSYQNDSLCKGLVAQQTTLQKSRLLSVLALVTYFIKSSNFFLWILRLKRPHREA